jgi:hypothetical protein
MRPLPKRLNQVETMPASYDGTNQNDKFSERMQNLTELELGPSPRLPQESHLTAAVHVGWKSSNSQTPTLISEQRLLPHPAADAPLFTSGSLKRLR